MKEEVNVYYDNYMSRVDMKNGTVEMCPRDCCSNIAAAQAAIKDEQ